MSEKKEEKQEPAAPDTAAKMETALSVDLSRPRPSEQKVLNSSLAGRTNLQETNMGAEEDE